MKMHASYLRRSEMDEGRGRLSGGGHQAPSKARRGLLAGRGRSRAALRPACEALEQRLALSVSAQLNGTELDISIDGKSTAYLRYSPDPTNSALDRIEVAGDPDFTNPQQFLASSIYNISAAGDTDKQRLIVTEGSIPATLTTSDIEEVSFEDGASFSGAVSVQLAAGDLTVDGLSSIWSGVTAQAAAGNLDLTGAWDAGGDVSLTSKSGSVALEADSDIAALGSVSLTGSGGISMAGKIETSGGNVTFNSPVTLTGSASVSTTDAGPYVIPIEHFTASNNKELFRIYASLNGGPMEPYLLDTGSPHVFATYGAWWPGTTVPTASSPGGQMQFSFASGIEYGYDAVSATVALGDSSGRVLTPGITANVGQIITMNSETPVQSYETWQEGVASTGTALSDGTYGNFGGGLYGDSVLATILAQLPLAPGLSPGFVVRSGGSDAQDGELIVGLTPAMVKSFSTTAQMTPSGFTLPNAYGVTVPGYTGTQAGSTAFSLGTSTNDPNAFTAPRPVVFDTGGGGTNVIYQDPLEANSAVPTRYIQEGAATGPIDDGIIYSIEDASGRVIYQLQVDSTKDQARTSVDDQYTDGLGVPRLNPGIGVFYTNDVMYDLGGGLLGLAPARPADDSLTRGSGDILFASTVDGAGPLSLSAATGRVTLAGVVGGVLPLQALSIDAPTASVGSISSVGAQSYQGTISFNGRYATDGGAFTVQGQASIAGPVAITTSGAGTWGTISFNGRIDGTAAGSADLTLSAGAAPIAFHSPVGSAWPLGSLTIASAGSVAADQAIQLDGSSIGAGPDGLTIGTGVTLATLLAPGSVIQHFAGDGVVFLGGATSSTLSGFTIRDNVYDGIRLLGGDFAGTTLSGNDIEGNGASGIEAAGAVTHLTIRDNTIAGGNIYGIALAPGDYAGTTILANDILFSKLDGVVTAGSVASLTVSGNTIRGGGSDGVQFGPGAYDGTSLVGNTIVGNDAYGVHLTGGATGLGIRGNTIGAAGAPNAAGVGVAGGDYTGTTIVGNTIQDNSGAGIDAGIGVPGRAAGDPLQGYSAYSQHYFVPYSNDPVFGSADPSQPRIAAVVGSTRIDLPIDTGSRGLYMSADLFDSPPALDGPSGYIYLNSSDRMMIGTWSTQTVTFPGATYYENGVAKQGPAAKAVMPVLIVTALGASTTPAPGQTTASTTFATTSTSGVVKITNGTITETVPIREQDGAGVFTVPGGFWATYADNAAIGLKSVVNFGVGFDRTGQGTYPNSGAYNQQYNAFLNLDQMKAGTMRAGFILTQTGVQLGLDETTSGYAYTDLAPTGLAQVPGSPPDWQAPTGTVTYDGQTFGTGQVVIDTGIPSGILTLPGYSAQSAFNGTLGVDLINSGGAVSYQINSATGNAVEPAGVPPVKPTGNHPVVTFFDPLSGDFSENLPSANDQFFNTGRDVLNAFDYLYDGAGGYLGLRPNSAPQSLASVAFTAAYYANPLPQAATAGPVTDLTIGGPGAGANAILGNHSDGIRLEAYAFTGTTIRGNVIAGNDGDGVNILGHGATVGGLDVGAGNTIDGNHGAGVGIAGRSAVDDAILSNAIFNNGGGISPVDGGNAGPSAPILQAVSGLVGAASGAPLAGVTIQGVQPSWAGYGGSYYIQFFRNSPSDAAAGLEGRTPIGTISTTAGAFSATFTGASIAPGDWITATATPADGARDTTAFSEGVPVMALVVTSSADSGPGSLREAILLANQNPGTETIMFAMTGSTIALASALPRISGPVIIDGRTQAGYSGTPIVTIDGMGVSGTANGLDVGPGAAGTQLFGLAIDDFASGSGIYAAAAGVTVRGNSFENDHVGILLDSAQAGAVTGNTILVGHGYGVYATGDLAGTVVASNYIRNSGGVGLLLDNARGLTVGGAGTGNVVVGTARWDTRPALSRHARRHGRLVRPTRKPAQFGIVVRGNSTGSLISGNTIADNRGGGVWLRGAAGISFGGRETDEHNRVLHNHGIGLRGTGDAANSHLMGNTLAGNRIEVKLSGGWRRAR